MRKTLLSVLASFLVLAFTQPAAAQDKTVEFTPFAGVYLSTADLISESGTVEGVDFDASLKQKTALAFGGRITGWFTDMVGVEGDFAYALSDVEISAAAGGTTADVDANANVWAGSGALVLAFPAGEMAEFRAKGGLAVIGHTSSDDPDLDDTALWDGVDGTTDLGGVLGIGILLNVSDNIGVRIDAQDLLYSAKFSDEETGEETDSEFQNDLLFSAGLSIGLGQ